MEYSRQDINAMFKADTAKHGEVLNIMTKGGTLRVKVTVKLQKQTTDKDYSLVSNRNIVAATDAGGCEIRTYTVREGRLINVFVKNLDEIPIQLAASHYDDHDTTTVDAVMIKPQSQHQMPVPFKLEPDDINEGWKLYFNGQTHPGLILIFGRDKNGEQSISELLCVMEKLLDAYKQ
jgi:hypothetical protein